MAKTAFNWHGTPANVTNKRTLMEQARTASKQGARIQMMGSTTGCRLCLPLPAQASLVKGGFTSRTLPRIALS